MAERPPEQHRTGIACQHHQGIQVGKVGSDGQDRYRFPADAAPVERVRQSDPEQGMRDIVHGTDSTPATPSPQLDSVLLCDNFDAGTAPRLTAQRRLDCCPPSGRSERT